MGEKMNPEDLTDHPNFPEYVDGITHEVYAEKIESYWINRRNRQLNRQMLGLSNPSITKKRKMAEFSLEEQKIIYDERIRKSMKLEAVAKKHDTIVSVINEIIAEQLKKALPD